MKYRGCKYLVLSHKGSVNRGILYTRDTPCIGYWQGYCRIIFTVLGYSVDQVYLLSKQIYTVQFFHLMSEKLVGGGPRFPDMSGKVGVFPALSNQASSFRSLLSYGLYLHNRWICLTAVCYCGLPMANTP